MSTIALICLGILGLASLLAAVWVFAYRLGFEEGRLTIPLRMLSTIAEHRVGCCDEEPARTVRDLAEHVGLPEAEAWRMIERAEANRQPRTPGLRSA